MAMRAFARSALCGVPNQAIYDPHDDDRRRRRQMTQNIRHGVHPGPRSRTPRLTAATSPCGCHPMAAILHTSGIQGRQREDCATPSHVGR